MRGGAIFVLTWAVPVSCRPFGDIVKCRSFGVHQTRQDLVSLNDSSNAIIDVVRDKWYLQREERFVVDALLFLPRLMPLLAVITYAGINPLFRVSIIYKFCYHFLLSVLYIFWGRVE